MGVADRGKEMTSLTLATAFHNGSYWDITAHLEAGISPHITTEIPKDITTTTVKIPHRAVVEDKVFPLKKSNITWLEGDLEGKNTSTVGIPNKALTEVKGIPLMTSSCARWARDLHIESDSRCQDSKAVFHLLLEYTCMNHITTDSSGITTVGISQEDITTTLGSCLLILVDAFGNLLNKVENYKYRQQVVNENDNQFPYDKWIDCVTDTIETIIRPECGPKNIPNSQNNTNVCDDTSLNCALENTRNTQMISCVQFEPVESVSGIKAHQHETEACSDLGHSKNSLAVVNVSDESGHNSLHRLLTREYSVWRDDRYWACVTKLVTSGVNLTHTDSKGDTCLHLLMRKLRSSCRAETAYLTDSNQQMCEIRAQICVPYADIIDTILECQGENLRTGKSNYDITDLVNVRNKDNKTALHLAMIAAAEYKVIRSLIYAGAEVNAREKEISPFLYQSTTRIKIAAADNRTQILQLYLQAGLDITSLPIYLRKYLFQMFQANDNMDMILLFQNCSCRMNLLDLFPAIIYDSQGDSEYKPYDSEDWVPSREVADMARTPPTLYDSVLRVMRSRLKPNFIKGVKLLQAAGCLPKGLKIRGLQDI